MRLRLILLNLYRNVLLNAVRLLTIFAPFFRPHFKHVDVFFYFLPPPTFESLKLWWGEAKKKKIDPCVQCVVPMENDFDVIDAPRTGSLSLTRSSLSSGMC